MRAGQRWCLALVLVAAGFGGGQQSVAAEGAECAATLVIVLDPGFSIEGSTGTHRSETPAALTCEGAVGGSPITGAGALTDEGPYGTEDPDGCLTGSEGTGIDHITVPTEAGPQVVESEYSYFAAKPANGSPLRGQFTGSRFTGTFELTPLEGDCVSAPITKVELQLQGVIHD